MSKTRIVVASLTLSASGLIGIAVHENYVSDAMIPTKNDRPTVGFGSTFHADGTPVKLGDKTDPVRALITLKAHVDKEEELFRKSLEGAYLYPAEYDLYVDFMYQFGISNWNGSSMRRHILAGEYRKACDALLMWKRSGGYDCSIPGNKRCAGVWTRQLERHAKCLEAQQ